MAVTEMKQTDNRQPTCLLMIFPSTTQGQPESQGGPFGTSRVSFFRVHLAYKKVKEPPQQTTNLAQPLRKVDLTQKTSESLMQGPRRDKKGKAQRS